MNLDDFLKKWNGGKLRGAPRKFADALGISETYFSSLRSGRNAPGEEVITKTAAVLKISPAEAAALYGRPQEAAMVGEVRPAYGLSFVRVPVVGVAGAAEFMFNFDDPPLEPITVPIEGSSKRRYGAFRVSGDCMEPRYHDGDIVVIAESETVPDGQPGVFRLDAHCTLKIPFRHADRVELRPINPKYKSIDIRSNKMTVVGVVVGVWRKP
jgi:SOS-response transcriptional repressor LexA